VPIPKIKSFRFKAVTCDDFRGIAINSIVSEVFEHCNLDKFESFLSTNDNQFGFKKGLGCSIAIYTVKSVVDRFIPNGFTANLCSTNLSKAFAKVNHHAFANRTNEETYTCHILRTIGILAL
jgi:hypothetical protein